MLIYLSLNVGGFLNMGLGHAQSGFDRILANILKAYKNKAGISFSAKLKLYDSNHTEKPLDTMNFTYALKEQNVFCKMGTLNMIVNNTYYVSIDNSNKIMLLGRQSDLSLQKGFQAMNLPTLLTRLKRGGIKSLSFMGHYGIIDFVNPKENSLISSGEINFDKATGFIRRSRFVLKTGVNKDENRILEIEYGTPVKLSSNQSLFSVRPYFSIVNGEVQQASRYKSYALINQL